MNNPNEKVMKRYRGCLSAVLFYLFSHSVIAQETIETDSVFNTRKVVIAGAQYKRGGLHNFLWGLTTARNGLRLLK